MRPTLDDRHSATETTIGLCHLEADIGAANTAGIAVEATSVQRDARGYIRVNERLETTAPSVWAIGECDGSLIGDDDRILGFKMIGSEAGEVMAAVRTAMLAALLHIAEGLGPRCLPPRGGRRIGWGSMN